MESTAEERTQQSTTAVPVTFSWTHGGAAPGRPLCRGPRDVAASDGLEHERCEVHPAVLRPSGLPVTYDPPPVSKSGRVRFPRDGNLALRRVVVAANLAVAAHAHTRQQVCVRGRPPARAREGAQDGLRVRQHPILRGRREERELRPGKGVNKGISVPHVMLRG